MNLKIKNFKSKKYRIELIDRNIFVLKNNRIIFSDNISDYLKFCVINKKLINYLKSLSE